MHYLLLTYEDERVYGPDKDSPAIQKIVAKHMAFGKDLGKVRVGGAGLMATNAVTTVRTSKGSKTVHDGPFAKTKEQLGGYYLIDVPDLDAAIAMAKKLS